MQPVFHPRTKLQFETFLKKPSHAVLLTGAEGSGKFFASKWLANQLDSEYIVVESSKDKSAITIDQIRELYNFTRTGNALAVIIKDAQELGSEAQNAFLKLLEEPPKNTTFILTALRPELLLSTIRSRVQHIEILPPSAQQLKESVNAEGNIDSLLITTKGLAGTFITLVENADQHTEHQEAIQLAKKFYAGSAYQRHLLCIENKYEKQWYQQLLQLLAVILASLIKQSATNTTVHAKLIRQVELLEETSHNLLKINGNPKIHLAKLCEELG